MGNTRESIVAIRARKTIAEKASYRELIFGIRMQLSLSQEELARKIGVSYASVNRWENGQVTPSKLAKARIRLLAARVKRNAKLSTSLRSAAKIEASRRLEGGQ